MFELLSDLKLLVEKVKAKDYLGAADKALEVGKKALELVRQLKDGGFFATPADGDVDAVLTELDALVTPTFGADPKNLSPVELIALVKAVVELVKWLRNR